MKNLVLTAALTAATLAASAQTTFFEGAVFSTGGSFGAPGNQVSAGYFQHETNQLNNLGDFYGDFSNAVAVDGIYAYIHVGRGFGNPAGSDVIQKIDLSTGTVVDSATVDIAGLQNMEIYGDQLIFNRGFGANSGYLISLDKNDFNPLFASTEIDATTTDMVIANDTAYVAYTHNDSGKVAVYDLLGSAPTFVKTITFDTLSAGLKTMVHTGNELMVNHARYNASFALLYDGVTRYNFATETFVSDTTVTGSDTYYEFQNGQILGNIGFQLQWLDVSNNSLTPINSLYSTNAFYNQQADVYYAQATDYSSIGELYVFDESGANLHVENTGISGTALTPVLNLHASFNDSTFQLSNNLAIDFNPTAVDYGDQVTITAAEVLGTQYLPADDVQFSGSLLTIGNLHMQNTDTIKVTYTDNFNRTHTDTVYASYLLSSAETSVRPSTKINVYPVPTQEILTLSGVEKVEGTEIQVFDLSGQLMLTTFNKVQLNVAELKAGVYILRVVEEKKTSTLRFVKS